MNEPVLVTGGTGRLGRVLVPRLRAAGRQTRVLTRTAGGAPGDTVTGDLVRGAGLDAALDGVGTVVHCATTNGKGDVEAARQLIAAAKRAGAPHMVYVSIVGIDEIPLPYYRAKLEVERLLRTAGLPWTVLRATQFHELVATVFELQRRSPVTLVPAGFRVQPVALADVADRLVELAGGEPVGMAADFGGPAVRGVEELARTYLRAAGRERAVWRLPLPGRIARAYREGHHLTPEHADGRGTFEDFLAERGD